MGERVNVGTVVFLLFCATHCSESVQASGEGLFVESFSCSQLRSTLNSLL